MKLRIFNFGEDENLLVAFGLVAGAALALMALVVYSFALPERERETQTLASYEHTGAYSYTVASEPSPINPSSTIGPIAAPPDGGSSTRPPAIFTSLARVIDFTYTYELKGVAEVEGTISADLEIRSGEAWSQVRELVVATPFRGATGSIQSSIDLGEIGTFLQQLEEQTGVRTGAVDLVITPTVQVQGTSNGEAIEDTFSAPFVFSYTSAQITPAETLTFTDPKTISSTVELDKEISFLGSSIRVSTMRIVATPLALIAMALAGLLAGVYFLGFGRPEAGMVRSRYRSLLVPIVEAESSVGHRISVASVHDLAHLAKREGRSLFVRDFSNDSHSYLVHDGMVIYEFASGDVPKDWIRFVGADKSSSPATGEQLAGGMPVAVQSDTLSAPGQENAVAGEDAGDEAARASTPDVESQARRLYELWQRHSNGIAKIDDTPRGESAEADLDSQDALTVPDVTDSPAAVAVDEDAVLPGPSLSEPISPTTDTEASEVVSASIAEEDEVPLQSSDGDPIESPPSPSSVEAEGILLPELVHAELLNATSAVDQTDSPEIAATESGREPGNDLAWQAAGVPELWPELTLIQEEEAAESRTMQQEPAGLLIPDFAQSEELPEQASPELEEEELGLVLAETYGSQPEGQTGAEPEPSLEDLEDLATAAPPSAEVAVAPSPSGGDIDLETAESEQGALSLAPDITPPSIEGWSGSDAVARANGTPAEQDTAEEAEYEMPAWLFEPYDDEDEEDDIAVEPAESLTGRSRPGDESAGPEARQGDAASNLAESELPGLSVRNWMRGKTTPSSNGGTFQSEKQQDGLPAGHSNGGHAGTEESPTEETTGSETPAVEATPGLSTTSQSSAENDGSLSQDDSQTGTALRDQASAGSESDSVRLGKKPTPVSIKRWLGKRSANDIIRERL